MFSYLGTSIKAGDEMSIKGWGPIQTRKMLPYNLIHLPWMVCSISTVIKRNAMTTDFHFSFEYVVMQCTTRVVSMDNMPTNYHLFRAVCWPNYPTEQFSVAQASRRWFEQTTNIPIWNVKPGQLSTISLRDLQRQIASPTWWPSFLWIWTIVGEHSLITWQRVAKWIGHLVAKIKVPCSIPLKWSMHLPYRFLHR